MKPHKVDTAAYRQTDSTGIVMIGDQQIIENKPYIYDETGKKIYIDPNNISAYAKIARQAPPGLVN